MKKAGYAACIAGQWHCNSLKQPQPGDFGFDHWFSTKNNAAPSHVNPKNFVRNGEPVAPLEGYSCHLIVNEAIAWLKKQNPDQPFFLYVPFHEPNQPVASPPDLVAKYRKISRNEDQAQYFFNVENMDRAVGRLMTELKQLKKHENTLVIFISDNGPETLKRCSGAGRSYGTPGPFRGMKLWTTAAGSRVPGIMR